MKTPARMGKVSHSMSHLRNLAKVSSGRAARSIWLAGTSRPWFIARTPRTMFTTSRRSSVEPNQHQEQVRQGEKLSGVEPPRFEMLPDDGSRPPLTYYPIVLLGVCLFAGWAVYDIYGTMTMWPEAVRSDLRQGVKHRNQGNLPLSIQHLQQAWETAKSLPLNSFGPDPLLKTSGIAIVLAGVLEDDNKKEEAYKVYQGALWQMQSAYLDLPPDAPQTDLEIETVKLLTPSEMLRAAALAYRLALMASELGKPKEEEEKWLTWSTNAILTTMEPPAGSEVAQIPPRARQLHIMGVDMCLPLWARDYDRAAPFETLGKFYTKHESRFYALPHYLQAIMILIPPSSPEDRCRVARLMHEMSIIALLFGSRLGFEDSSAEAISWAQRALNMANDARQSHKGKLECNYDCIAISFHLGWLHRYAEEYDKAREVFETIVKESNAIGSKAVAESAQEELEKLDLEIRRRDKTVTVAQEGLHSEIRDNSKDKTVAQEGL